jgi:hypothetical protein
MNTLACPKCKTITGKIEPVGAATFAVCLACGERWQLPQAPPPAPVKGCCGG